MEGEKGGPAGSRTALGRAGCVKGGLSPPYIQQSWVGVRGPSVLGASPLNGCLALGKSLHPADGPSCKCVGKGTSTVRSLRGHNEMVQCSAWHRAGGMPPCVDIITVCQTRGPASCG